MDKLLAQLRAQQELVRNQASNRYRKLLPSFDLEVTGEQEPEQVALDDRSLEWNEPEPVDPWRPAVESESNEESVEDYSHGHTEPEMVWPNEESVLDPNLTFSLDRHFDQDDADEYEKDSNQVEQRELTDPEEVKEQPVTSESTEESVEDEGAAETEEPAEAGFEEASIEEPDSTNDEPEFIGFANEVDRSLAGEVSEEETDSIDIGGSEREELNLEAEPNVIVGDNEVKTETETEEEASSEDISVTEDNQTIKESDGEQDQVEMSMPEIIDNTEKSLSAEEAQFVTDSSLLEAIEEVEENNLEPAETELKTEAVESTPEDARWDSEWQDSAPFSYEESQAELAVEQSELEETAQPHEEGKESSEEEISIPWDQWSSDTEYVSRPDVENAEQAEEQQSSSEKAAEETELLDNSSSQTTPIEPIWEADLDGPAVWSPVETIDKTEENETEEAGLGLEQESFSELWAGQQELSEESSEEQESVSVLETEEDEDSTEEAPEEVVEELQDNVAGEDKSEQAPQAPAWPIFRPRSNSFSEPDPKDYPDGGTTLQEVVPEEITEAENDSNEAIEQDSTSEFKEDSHLDSIQDDVDQHLVEQENEAENEEVKFDKPDIDSLPEWMMEPEGTDLVDMEQEPLHGEASESSLRSEGDEETAVGYSQASDSDWLLEDDVEVKTRAEEESDAQLSEQPHWFDGLPPLHFESSSEKSPVVDTQTEELDSIEPVATEAFEADSSEMTPANSANDVQAIQETQDGNEPGIEPDESIEAKPFVSPEAAALSQTWTCPLCGFVNTEGAFCGQCGSSQEEIGLVCPRCGSFTLKEAVFCGTCGQDLSSVSLAPTVEEAQEDMAPDHEEPSEEVQFTQDDWSTETAKRVSDDSAVNLSQLDSEEDSVSSERQAPKDEEPVVENSPEKERFEQAPITSEMVAVQPSVASSKPKKGFWNKLFGKKEKDTVSREDFNPLDEALEAEGVNPDRVIPEVHSSEEVVGYIGKSDEATEPIEEPETSIVDQEPETYPEAFQEPPAASQSEIEVESVNPDWSTDLDDLAEPEWEGKQEELTDVISDDSMLESSNKNEELDNTQGEQINLVEAPAETEEGPVGEEETVSAETEPTGKTVGLRSFAYQVIEDKSNPQMIDLIVHTPSSGRWDLAEIKQLAREISEEYAGRHVVMRIFSSAEGRALEDRLSDSLSFYGPEGVTSDNYRRDLALFNKSWFADYVSSRTRNTFSVSRLTETGHRQQVKEFDLNDLS